MNTHNEDLSDNESKNLTLKIKFKPNFSSYIIFKNIHKKI